MTHSKVLLLFVLLAGVSIGAWARGAISNIVPDEAVTNSGTPREDTGTTDSAGLSGAAARAVYNQPELLKIIEALQLELDGAREEREDLRGQIDELSAQVASINAGFQGSIDPALAKERAKAARRRSVGGLTVAGLRDAGIAESEAIAIKRRLDEIALERLYLRDQAMREGTLGKANYQQEMKRINAAQNNLRDEFGADAYERYLYAIGRPNSVTVQSVMENSPAYSSGLQPGDRIVSYDNRPIYNPNEIRRSTMGGTAGEMVPIIVERDGMRTDMYIPRGPLGIQMNAVSAKPPKRQ